jgi:23S rRNA (adenine-N6)-dimethyltransferase
VGRRTGRTARDERRRWASQNFLVDPGVVDALLARLCVEPGERVVDLGAGTGALTLPLARAGAEVVAVEIDPVWAARLRRRLRADDLSGQVRVLELDFRRLSLPRGRYRIVANPPFSLTTAVLAKLLDDPDRGPWRADLLLADAVVRKRAAQPPTTLRSAAWSPWWTFEAGPRVNRRAFRPVPRTDAAWLTVRRNTNPVLPTWLAADFPDALRTIWTPPG